MLNSKGGPAVGWLTAAFGAGGLVAQRWPQGPSASPALAAAFIAGLLLWGLPLAILALTPVAAIAYLALVVVGIGKAVVAVSGFTLVTRLAGPGTAGKALGAPEFVALAGLATGSIGRYTMDLLHHLDATHNGGIPDEDSRRVL